MAEPINLDLLARHLQAIRAELRDMQFHAESDRRNVRSQFDNLTATHASQLGDIEAKMAARLDRVETFVGERFSYLDERIGTLEERMSTLEERLGDLDKRITGHMEHLIALVERVLKTR
jgi:predicted  nucleic acid-binding Zn-ribbon protein